MLDALTLAASGAAVAFTDAIPAYAPDDATDAAPLNPARALLALRDKAQALAHLQAAADLLKKRTGFPAAERALDDVDDVMRALIGRVTLCVGILNAAGGVQ